MIARICRVLFAMMICVPTPGWAKDQEFARPPYAGAYEPQGVDERGLWMQLDEAERQIRDSPMVLRDERLNAYLHEVLCDAVGAERCRSVRIYVIRDDGFNASMAPNGTMFIHTGLLARIFSEAELAAVLGHEFAHFERRHSLEGFRKLRTASDILAWVSLAGATFNTNTQAVQLGVVGSYFTFNRKQESEADALSATFIKSSPYPLQAAGIWSRLSEEDDAWREERKLRKIRNRSPSLLDTHPTNLERFTYFAELEKEPEALDGDPRTERYAQEMDRLLPEFFDGLVKSNRFASADYVIQKRGDKLGWSGKLLYIRGELYRLRGNPRDLVTARDFFEQAAVHPDAPPETWRGIGFTALRSGDAEAGKTALRAYLAKAPDAGDLAAVSMLLEN